MPAVAAVQLCLPLQLQLLIFSGPATARRRPRRHRPHCPLQLVLCFPPSRPRRQRRIHPRAAAHALAMEHLDLADKIAGNFARRTFHPFDDLRQLAVIGLLKAADRFDPSSGRPFRPYARTFANGEITHFLRDHGFAIKVPPSWRDLYASGQKLQRLGLHPSRVPEELGIRPERWREIEEACTVAVVALPLET